MSVFNDPSCYPAISLHQPYAGAIRLSGLGYPAKRIETRKTRIHYRGPLVICATKTSFKSWQATRDTINATVDPLARHAAEVFALTACAVAIVNVVGCRVLTLADERAALFYAPGRWAWELEDITPLRPFAVKGSQGFFKVDREHVDYAARGALTELFWASDDAPISLAAKLGAESWPLPVEQEGGRS